jgi:hypothetical protein
VHTAAYRKKYDAATLPRTLPMVLPVLSQASPTTTSFPAVVGAARVQVCVLAPEEVWVQTVCEALIQETAACAGSEPRDRTAMMKKLFSVTRARRIRRLDNVAIAVSLQKPEVLQNVVLGPAKVS